MISGKLPITAYKLPGITDKLLKLIRISFLLIRKIWIIYFEMTSHGNYIPMIIS